MYRVKINVNSLKQKIIVQSGWLAYYFTIFRLFPTCRCFPVKEKELLGVWWEKQGDVPVKKKKSEQDNVKDISKYKEVVQSNLSWNPPLRTLERLCEHMFKWVIHEMFHNRNAFQTIKCVAVSHLSSLFSRACNISSCRVRITCYFASFPDL